MLFFLLIHVFSISLSVDNQKIEMLKRVAPILLIGLVSWGWGYKALLRPPPPKICGSPGGPPITGPRIKLRDGRHLAYKEYGVPREEAKYKIVYVHGFTSSRHGAALISTDLSQPV